MHDSLGWINGMNIRTRNNYEIKLINMHGHALSIFQQILKRNTNQQSYIIDETVE